MGIEDTIGTMVDTAREKTMGAGKKVWDLLSLSEQSLDEFFVGLERSIHRINTFMGRPAGSECDLVSLDYDTNPVGEGGGDDPVAFTTQKMGLMTPIRIKGSREMVNQDRFEHIIRSMYSFLSSKMNGTGHRLQWTFHHDPNAEQRLEELLSSTRATGRRLGLKSNEIDDLLDDTKEALGRYCAKEQQTLCLWTFPSILPQSEAKRVREEQIDHIYDNVPSGPGSQVLDYVHERIRDKHLGFTGGVHNTFEDARIVNRYMGAHEYLMQLRRQLDPNGFSDQWEPYLPGDPVPFTYSRNMSNGLRDGNSVDYSPVMYPAISDQLFNKDAVVEDGRTVRIGETWFTPVLMRMYPKEIEAFSSLHASIVNQGMDIPFRLSIRMAGQGMMQENLNLIAARAAKKASMENKRIVQAYNHLNEHDDPIVRLSISAVVWGNTRKKCRRNAEQMIANMDGWGAAQSSTISGEPWLVFCGNLPGFKEDAAAYETPAPLTDALSMLPVERPLSLWEHGEVIFRDPDGRIMPKKLLSSEEDASVDTVIAPPGGGKSVALNHFTDRFLQKDGINNIPFASVLDVGPSSAGLISKWKQMLPRGKEHLAEYFRWEMDEEYATNPFDTELGCRYPFPSHASFLVRFMTLLATPPGQDHPHRGTRDIAKSCVEAAYEQLHPKRAPRSYDPTEEPKVEKALRAMEFNYDENTTWWEVVDHLYANGAPYFDNGQDQANHLATLAQRHAVPRMSDVISMLGRDEVTGIHDEKLPGGEDLISAIETMWQSAINDYEVLRGTTKFDIGETRILSIDLDDVVETQGSGAEKKKSAVMYMLARHYGVEHFYHKQDYLNYVPDAYKDYHRERIDTIRSTPKRVTYDEAHHPMKLRSSREQIVRDIREGRKWGFSIALATHLIKDFPDEIRKLSTSVYLFGANTPEDANAYQDMFEFSDEAKDFLLHKTGTPDKKGANVLGMHQTSVGFLTQRLTLTLGPKELWAYSTDPTDVAIRERLNRHLGTSRARDILSERFPGGTAESRLEELDKMAERERQQIYGEQSNIEIIVDELLDYAKSEGDEQ